MIFSTEKAAVDCGNTDYILFGLQGRMWAHVQDKFLFGSRVLLKMEVIQFWPVFVCLIVNAVTTFSRPHNHDFRAAWKLSAVHSNFIFAAAIDFTGRLHPLAPTGYQSQRASQAERELHARFSRDSSSQ